MQIKHFIIYITSLKKNMFSVKVPILLIVQKFIIRLLKGSGRLKRLFFMEKF